MRLIKYLVPITFLIGIMFIISCTADRKDKPGKDKKNTADNSGKVGKKDKKKTNGKGNEIVDDFVEDQPEFPAGDDDPYFKVPPERSEIFRILITGGNSRSVRCQAKSIFAEKETLREISIR